MELTQLLSTLERVGVCGVLEDRWVWENEGSRLFTCKSLFNSLIDKPTNTPWKFYHFIYKVLIPTKVRVFGWLLILKKLNTQDLWKKKKKTPFLSISPSSCTICKNESESINHLLLHCSVAQRVWWFIIQKFKVS